MGDITIPADITEGVAEIMEEVGWTIIFRRVEYGPIDPDNPGAAPIETVIDKSFEGFIYDYEDRFINGTSVLQGDRLIIISIDGFTQTEIDAVEPPNYIVDSGDVYGIIESRKIDVSGITSVIIAQIRG